MSQTLNWHYQGDHEVAAHPTDPTIRIRAVRDEGADNPFTDHDGNWPICVRSPDGYGGRTEFNDYDKVSSSGTLFDPLTFANDATLVHLQHNLARVFGSTVNDLLDNLHGVVEEPVKYCRDPDMLREAFENAMGDVSDSDRFELCVKLYEVLGIPALCGQSNGYSQSDWCEVLVVATPEAVKTFGIEGTTEQLQAAIDLYGAWAWGDVYGYIVEQQVGTEAPDDFEDDPDYAEAVWEEIEDGSCWGYYGSDHAESGLEEAALDAAAYHIKQREKVDA